MGLSSIVPFLSLLYLQHTFGSIFSTRISWHICEEFLNKGLQALFNVLCCPVVYLIVDLLMPMQYYLTRWLKASEALAKKGLEKKNTYVSKTTILPPRIEA